MISIRGSSYVSFLLLKIRGFQGNFDASAIASLRTELSDRKAFSN